MDNKSDNNRIESIDNIKGILIFLVVFGHFLLVQNSRESSICLSINNVIYAIHMPFFMFISGVVTHHKTKDWYIDNIILYTIANSIYYIIGIYYCNEKISILNPAYSMWYLISLILFRAIAEIFKGKLKYLLLTLSIIIFVELKCIDMNGLFLHVKISAFFIYFVLGYIFQDRIINILSAEQDIIVKVIGALLLIICIFIYFDSIKNLKFTHNALYNEQAYNDLDLLFSIIMLALNLIIMLLALVSVPNKNIPLLSNFGKNSMTIYILHRVITMLKWRPIGDLEWAISSFILAVVICVVLSNGIVVCKIKCIRQHIKRGQYCVIALLFIILAVICCIITLK